MNHTDTIRELLLEHPFGGPEFGGCECGQIIGGAQDVWADHLAPIIANATAPKTISTAAELGELPDGSIIIDATGMDWRADGCWWDHNGMPTSSVGVIDSRGPVTVLHEGDAK